MVRNYWEFLGLASWWCQHDEGWPTCQVIMHHGSNMVQVLAWQEAKLEWLTWRVGQLGVLVEIWCVWTATMEGSMALLHAPETHIWKFWRGVGGTGERHVTPLAPLAWVNSRAQCVDRQIGLPAHHQIDALVTLLWKTYFCPLEPHEPDLKSPFCYHFGLGPLDTLETSLALRTHEEKFLGMVHFSTSMNSLLSCWELQFQCIF